MWILKSKKSSEVQYDLLDTYLANPEQIPIRVAVRLLMRTEIILNSFYQGFKRFYLIGVLTRKKGQKHC